jgi:hypothetical protein
MLLPETMAWMRRITGFLFLLALANQRWGQENDRRTFLYVDNEERCVNSVEMSQFSQMSHYGSW